MNNLLKINNIFAIITIDYFKQDQETTNRYQIIHYHLTW